MSISASVNGFDVISLCITRAKWGRAMLECRLAETVAKTKLEEGSQVVVDFARASKIFTGQVWRVGPNGGTTELTVIEAKKLDSSIKAQFYRTVDAKRIANDLLRDAGVTGEVTVARAFDVYVRSAGTAIAALNEFCDTTLATWRTRPDGSVIVQPNTTAPTRNSKSLEWGTELLKFDPVNVEFESLPRPDLYPNMIVSAAPYDQPRDVLIERLQHTLLNGVARTCFWGKRNG